MAFNNFKVMQNKEILENQTEQKGGDYTPPAEGRVGLRLVGYVELGKHAGEYMGKPKVNDKVRLIFELHGKKWEPTKLDSGEIVPVRMGLTMNKSFTKKSAYYKLFLKMRDEREEVTHMIDMLGEAFLADVRHETSEKDGKVYASLKNKDGDFTIRPPYVEENLKDEDGELTGEVERKRVKVNDPIGDCKLFIWDAADEEQWASIYIPGEYDGKSKNTLQLEICKAVNFPGSLAEALATESGVLEQARKGVQSASEHGDVDESDPDGASEKASGKTTQNKKPPRNQSDKSSSTGEKSDDAGDGEVKLDEID